MRNQPLKKMVSKLRECSFRHYLTIAFFLLLVGYGIYQTKNLIMGPEIVIAAPQNGAALALNPVEINGQAERIAFLSLNGERIFTDENGRFSQKLLLTEGYNIIRLEARDKFGRTVQKVLNLVYEQ